MPYTVELTSEAIDDLRHLDKPVAQRILRRLKRLSEDVENVNLEALSAEFKGLFKLRVGSYRVIYEVKR